MDELREAVAALFEAALSIKSRLTDCEDPPSKSQLVSLQESVDVVQQSLNRLQTAPQFRSRRTTKMGSGAVRPPRSGGKATQPDDGGHAPRPLQRR
jgi:hypothetical protein